MIVATYGAWYSDRGGFTCAGTLDEFAEAGKQLGHMLAEMRCRVIVTSHTEHTIDGYVIDGYLEALNACGVAAAFREPPLILVKFDVRQQDGERDVSDARFAQVFANHGRYFTYESAQGLLRFGRHLAGLKRADAIVTVGGADHTFMAGEVAKLAEVPLVPIGSFGGASAELLKETLRETEDPATKALFGQLVGPWCEPVLQAVTELLRRREIVVVHGHGDDWQRVRDIVKNYGLPGAVFYPVILRERMGAAEVLSSIWESIASHARAAIAVVTPDDVGGVASETSRMFRARQNVWLEVGWIWGRIGRQKLLLLVRGDLEVPSDFAGVVYHRYRKSPDERQHEIQSFLDTVA